MKFHKIGNMTVKTILFQAFIIIFMLTGCGLSISMAYHSFKTMDGVPVIK